MCLVYCLSIVFVPVSVWGVCLWCLVAWVVVLVLACSYYRLCLVVVLRLIKLGLLFELIVLRIEFISDVMVCYI